MKTVNRPCPKKDAEALTTGVPAYTEDLIPPGSLCIKLLRSPHAHAKILSVDKRAALAVPGHKGLLGPGGHEHADASLFVQQAGTH